MKNDYKKLYEKYQIESEAYALAYEDDISPTRALLVMGGLLVRMESDLISYELKHGKNERAISIQEKIDVLKSIYGDFSSINEQNRRFKILMRTNSARMAALEQELERYKQLEFHKLEFEQE